MLPEDPHCIHGWQRISDRITTSGRLVADDIEDLAAIGVRHVIDLAAPEHEWALPDEEQRLAAFGIAYTRILVPFNAPTDEHYAQFVAALENGPTPVHLHCIYNFRVSAFLFRYHLQTGMAENKAADFLIPIWSPEASEHPAAEPWKAFIRDSRLAARPGASAAAVRHIMSALRPIG